MSTYETDRTDRTEGVDDEIDHADENYGVDSEGDEVAQEQAAEAQEAEPVIDEDEDLLDHTDSPPDEDAPEAGIDTDGLADPDADTEEEAETFGAPDQQAIALGPIGTEAESEDDDLADEPVIVELEETEVEVLDEPVDDADLDAEAEAEAETAADGEADDESVLLTESEPGSVLPPEEPEESEEPEEPEDLDSPADDQPEASDETATEADEPLPVPGPSPEELLAPVGADAPLDPGTGSYQERWSAIQGGFVDDPHRTVESAGELLTQMWAEVERAMAEQRAALDDTWDDGSSTDELRAAFRSYREMFHRLTALLSETQPSG
jgi:hypothetical protein